MLASDTRRTLAAVALAMAVVLNCAAALGVEAPKEIKTESGVAMIALPGGTFTMGDPDGEIDETPHAVTVGAFAIDKHEVTQEEYERVVGDNPSKVIAETNPVEQVRWSDAVRYCNERSRLEGLEPVYDLKTWKGNFEANGYRLPTEAEWEYAARAGTGTSWSFGSAPAKLTAFAWFKKTARGKPRPVAQRKPNPWGLHDMHGNVWEWCNDFYDVDAYGEDAVTDPRGPASGETKVLRGGCWNSEPDACRSAYRYNENPGYADACFGYDIYGFRCVRPRKRDGAK